jgi:hypothetical protein
MADSPLRMAANSDLVGLYVAGFAGAIVMVLEDTLNSKRSPLLIPALRWTLGGTTNSVLLFTVMVIRKIDNVILLLA